MTNTQTQPLTWAQKVEAMHTRQASDEASVIREALPEKVRNNEALREHLVLYLMETKANLDEHSGGRLPEGMTKEEFVTVQKRVREFRAALQAVPGALRVLEPAFDQAIQNADDIDAFLTDREDRIKGRYAAKQSVEEHIAFLLDSHGIALTKYDAGDLAKVLHVAYRALEGKEEGDAGRVVRRLCDEASAGFADRQAHERHAAFFNALLQLPATRDPKKLERQGEVYRQAVEAHEPEHPSMCAVVLEAVVNR